jgi:hypothetical protein
MVVIIKLTGVSEIKAAMEKASRRLSTSTREALTRAGLFLQRESQKIVPVKHGVLKNSAGTSVSGQGWFTEVVVYYTASYAVWVHERTDLKHKPGKEAKFLEKPAREKRAEILALIAGDIVTDMEGKTF